MNATASRRGGACRPKLVLGLGATVVLLFVWSIGGSEITVQPTVAPTTSGSTQKPQHAPNELDQHWPISTPHVDDVVRVTSQLSQSCGSAPSTFEPLGTFKFWGRLMNETSPCPTSGMNNQFTMLVALVHCAMELSSRGALPGNVFRWKDISCSPTGGREGRSKYAVGSEDYEYAWFRWSEVLDVPMGLASIVMPSAELPVVLCLKDTYSWKEDKAMSSCSTNVGHLYGTPAYWTARRSLRFRPRYLQLAQCFVRWASTGAVEQNAKLAWNECGSSSSPVAMKGRLIVAHIRRGDYEHFCRGIVSNFGRNKFRTPLFVAMRRGNASIAFSSSRNVMSACAPNDVAIMSALKRVVADEKRKSATAVTVAIATNAPSVVKLVATALQSESAVVATSSFTAWLSLAAEGGSPRPSKWPENLGGGRFTPTDAAVGDIAVLSSGDAVVLNRYSTYSHTAVDERVIRDGGSFKGLSIYWW